MITSTVNKSLITEYMPLVHYVASDFASRSGQLSWESLVTSGVVALERASDLYRPDSGQTFGAFAKRYIAAHILDEVALGPLSKSRAQEILDSTTPHSKAELPLYEIHSGDPESARRGTERFGEMIQAVQELPADESHVIDRLYLRDMTVAETANDLGLTVQTIDSCRRSAFRRLSELDCFSPLEPTTASLTTTG